MKSSPKRKSRSAACSSKALKREFRDVVKPEKKFLRAEKTLFVLASKTRLKMIALLNKRPMCGYEFVAIIGLRQPTISHHLALLQEAGLITGKRDRQVIRYSLTGNLPKVSDLIK